MLGGGGGGGGGAVPWPPFVTSKVCNRLIHLSFIYFVGDI